MTNYLLKKQDVHFIMSTIFHSPYEQTGFGMHPQITQQTVGTVDFIAQSLMFCPCHLTPKIFRLFPTWGCIWVINQELLERAEMLANEGWLKTLEGLSGKSTVCKLRISFFPRKRDPRRAFFPPPKKSPRPKKTERFVVFFQQTQRLLHIVWAKCITSLKVWTIACLGEAGPRGPRGT